MPDQLAARQPVHLVCLVEVCGGDDRLQLRIDRLAELIAEAENGAGRLRVSVVAYGPHGVAWKVEDRPPEIRAWAASGARGDQRAARAGRPPGGRAGVPAGGPARVRPRAGAGHLSAADGRPVIVTAGGRPPHPPATGHAQAAHSVSRLGELGWRSSAGCWACRGSLRRAARPEVPGRDMGAAWPGRHGDGG